MDKEQESHEFQLVGELKGHSDWVTCIVAGQSLKENEDSPVLVSGSRDKSLIIWKLFDEEQDGKCGQAYRALTGHNHFISDLAISQENSFVLSSSWDKTLRLWDLRQGKTTKQFFGHEKEVLTVAFSPDNRQILSAGADCKIKLWNTLADCKYTSEQFNHSDWVSQIRYSPINKSQKAQVFDPYFASVGWDGRLKIWKTNFQVKYTFKAHEGNINSISISPNGKYLASGGKDRKLNVWDYTDLSHPSREFDTGGTVNTLAFNPKLQWIATGGENGVRIWDLMSTQGKPISEMENTVKDPKTNKTKSFPCTSLTWNSLGKKLFVGFADGTIKVWHVTSEDKNDK